MLYKTPKNDAERVLNLLEALSNRGDDAEPGKDAEKDPVVEQMHRELAKRGHTLESWAAYWQGRAQEVIDAADRARIKRGR
jgi:hypothetical protein